MSKTEEALTRYVLAETNLNKAESVLAARIKAGSSCYHEINDLRCAHAEYLTALEVLEEDE